MQARNPDELTRLGADAFTHFVKPRLRPDDDGKFAAIDVDTGDYELDDDDYSAVMRLRSRRPTAELWLARIGQPTAYRMGARPEVTPAAPLRSHRPL